MQSYIIEIMLILVITISTCIFLYAKSSLIKSIGQLVFAVALSALITYMLYRNGTGSVINALFPLITGGLILGGGYLLIVFLEKRAEQIESKKAKTSQKQGGE